MPASDRLEIIVSSRSWSKVKGLKSRLNKATQVTLGALPAKVRPVAARAQMTLLLTTDKAVQKLNVDYRKIDKPTNVLSFPQYDRLPTPRQLPLIGYVAMGDIVMAYAYVLAEAKREKKKPLDHITHLLIHGILHLFGYDHMTPRQAKQMEALEKDIMAEMGLPDPYAEIDD